MWMAPLVPSPSYLVSCGSGLKDHGRRYLRRKLRRHWTLSALESEEEEGKSNFIVDWFGAYMMSRVPSGRKG